MRAEVLARALGGEWRGSYGTAKCPAHQDSTPSLSIKDGNDGRLLLYCHAGCTFEAIVAALKDRCFIEQPNSGRQSKPRPHANKDYRPLADLIVIIWKQAIPIRRTLAERYLVNRSIDAVRASSLLFHRRLRHPSGQYLPAILGLVEDMQTEFTALHRTLARRQFHFTSQRILTGLEKETTTP